MEKLLYIDACFRENESRTRKIALPVVEALKNRYEVETINLNDLELIPVMSDEIAKRLGGNPSKESLEWANKVKNADRIVIAAPFWDMSIPSALKVFIELCSIFDVTFTSDDKTCYGLCKCKKMLFITTRGMNIPTGDVREQATSYLRALSTLWNLGELEVIARQNFDYLPAEIIEKEIQSAIAEGIEMAKTF